VSQLNNTNTRRKALPYLFLALIAVLVFVLDYQTRAQSALHPDRITDFLYLFIAMVVLSTVEVRIERGRLTLSGLIFGAAAILLNPIDATVVGLAIGLVLRNRGPWPLLANAILIGASTAIAATIAAELRVGGDVSLGARVFVVLVSTVASWALVAAVMSLRTAESIRSIVKHNFTPSFYLAYGYFSLGALLISYVLDGSPLGYLLATIVCVLALALTDTISGRRVRRVLESELSDADRHLFHSRAVEGVVHNLRNHVANAVGYLKEVDSRRLDPVDRVSIETATAAATDAVTVLKSLSQGATPRVTYASEPVDLNELITRALGMARPRARSKEVQLALRESAEPVNVRADPLLLREVITNLVNNAIDAVASHGHVELRAGRRGNGWPYFSVVDDGPGVSDDNRHHLFEPHFTTKEGGTGLGLFMSYGIVREHQGQLIYEGNRRGGVFTVTLPPFSG
jgi:signal transduction histidine kinase